MLSRMLDRYSERMLADEASLVADRARARRMVVRCVVVAVVGWLSLVGLLWLPPGTWGGVVAGLVLAVVLGPRLLAPLTRAQAYRRGWVDGRAAMVRALAEAKDRDLTLDDWLRGELERDYALVANMLNLKPPPDDADR